MKSLLGRAGPPGACVGLRRAGLAGLLSIVALAPAGGSVMAADTARELEILVRSMPGNLQPGAESGSPPALEIRQDGRLYGYAFSTYAVTGSLGYSGRPVDIHVVLTVDGRVTEARLARQEEPILVIGISPQALEAFVRRLSGLDIRGPVTVRSGAGARGMPDHVAGATVSSAVMRDAVLRSARAVAQTRGLLSRQAGAAEVDRAAYSQASWQDLIGWGAVARRAFTRGDVAAAGAPAQRPSDELFIELYATLLTPPTVGQNLLGRREFERLQGQLADGEHAILIAGRGLYSIKGTSWRQSGVFDRLQIVQGTTTIKLKGEAHQNIERLAIEGAPELREIGVFRIGREAGFDPVRPWRVELLVETGRDAKGAVLALEYKVPQRFLVTPASAPMAAPAGAPASAAPPTPATEPQSAREGAPEAGKEAAVLPSGQPAPAGAVEAAVWPEERPPELWEQIWLARRVDVILTVILLQMLTVILFSHDLLVRNVRRYRIVRLSFLSATTLVLGLIVGAQLSVVHVTTFAHALLSGFRWEQFLLDPPIFILWSFVALALLFWGRGVFCGWLCPFGALQELINEVGRKLGIRQIELPWSLHERLWPIKYAMFLLILGVSLKSASQAFMLAEVEPFKTVVTLWFLRDWQYVLYALVLLGAGLFIGRFYCRYLCPLGAALAIPARLRLFEWLKRRPQCGRECRICATRCTVQAINPLGQIVPNECIYCLQCQANYYDATTCLPLKMRAQRQTLGARPAGAAEIRERDDVFQ